MAALRWEPTHVTKHISRDIPLHVPFNTLTHCETLTTPRASQKFLNTSQGRALVRMLTTF